MPEILKFNEVQDTKTLKEKITKDLPNRKIQNILFEKGFQVRKSGFTTQNVTVKPDQKNGTIKLMTSLDLLVVYALICWPLALYIYINRKKHKALQLEVVEKLKSYHLN